MAEGTRRLVAIMFTDIVGYTALMGQDEQRTIELVNRARELLHGQLAIDWFAQDLPSN